MRSLCVELFGLRNAAGVNVLSFCPSLRCRDWDGLRGPCLSGILLLCCPPFAGDALAFPDPSGFNLCMYRWNERARPHRMRLVSPVSA